MSLNPQLEKQAKKIQELIRTKTPEELSSELQKQLNNKFADLFETINRLNQYDYKRDAQTKESVWTQGSTSVFSYEAESPESPIVIFIPSLINRSYILDISPNRSFLKYLQKQNINSYLVDWGEPEEGEADLSLNDYIVERLDSIISHIVKKTGRKVILSGYCMGGLIALASSLRNQEKVKALALLACPWDFHAQDFARFELSENSVAVLEGLINNGGNVSANIIQSIFYYLHPDLIGQKFENFSNNDSKEIEEFAAIEHWLNDGISMTRNVAKECFINWVHKNSIVNGNWDVGGDKVNPAVLDMPTLFVTSKKDSIVPKASTAPLIELIKNKEILETNTGHISMVAGSRAKQLVWKPFEKWVKSLP